jgi:hypothetical protein
MKQGKLARTELVSYADNYVMVPVDLCVDVSVPGEAIALYCVMKSFGPRAAAKVSTYGLRLGWHEDRVKRYQKLLQQAGWIVLVREGGQSLSKGGQKIYEPRLWWMCAKKKEQPRLTGAGGGEMPSPAKEGAVKQGPLEFRPPRFAPPKQKKAFQAAESPEKKEKDDPPAPAGGAFKRLSAIRLKSRYARALMPTATNIRSAVQLEGLLGQDLEAAYQVYLADPSPRLCDERHPLGWMLSTLDSYLPDTPRIKASPGLRQSETGPEDAAAPPGGPSLADRVRQLLHPRPPAAA